MADYASERYEMLLSKGFEPCQSLKIRPIVTISEKGKTYRAAIPKELMSAVFHIDGDIINNGERCDAFVVALQKLAKERNGIAVFVELKGVDVSHAVDQIEDTIKNSLFRPFPKPQDIVKARIVTAGCGPKSSSKKKVEEARIRFKKLYNIELRILKNSQIDTL